MWAGGMWHADPTHNTFITTGNRGSDPTTAEATLFYNGGKDKYRVEKKLAPGEQLWLDVGEVLRDQVPDSDGHTMPPDTMAGSYELRDLDHAYVGQLYEGKLVIDKTYGHAAYGCGSCCQYGVPYFLVDPFGGPPDDDFGETLESTDSCGGFLVDVTGGGYAWGSSNTAVATLTSPTLHSGCPGVSDGQCRDTFPVTNSVPGIDGVFQDTHSYPGFQGPYQANSFTATQYYQYICPCASDGQPVNVMGPLSIARTVYFSSPSDEWIYQASKSGRNRKRCST